MFSICLIKKLVGEFRICHVFSPYEKCKLLEFSHNSAGLFEHLSNYRELDKTWSNYVEKDLRAFAYFKNVEDAKKLIDMKIITVNGVFQLKVRPYKNKTADVGFYYHTSI
jgi:hypothetical protein